MRYRIPLGRVLCDTCYYRTLRDVQFGNVLTEISLRSCLYTERSLTEVDRVQIVLEYLILAHLLLELYRAVLLLELSLELVDHAALFGPRCEHVVLQKLLRDRRCTLMEVSAKRLDTRTHDTLDIDTVMRVKSLVLYRHESVLHIKRYLVEFDIHTV